MEVTMKVPTTPLRRIALVGAVCAAIAASVLVFTLLNSTPSATPGAPQDGEARGTPAVKSTKPLDAQNLTSGVPFEIVAEGAPFVGDDTGRPIMLAIEGSDPDPEIPKGLPDEAQETLRTALAKSDSGLYIVVYTGVRPSSGYAVHIDSIALRRVAGRDQLAVNFREEEPSPGVGAATVLTHPYVIARVIDSPVGAADVVFERQ
jgi:hypothetical protein